MRGRPESAEVRPTIQGTRGNIAETQLAASQRLKPLQSRLSAWPAMVVFCTRLRPCTGKHLLENSVSLLTSGRYAASNT